MSGKTLNEENILDVGNVVRIMNRLLGGRILENFHCDKVWQVAERIIEEMADRKSVRVVDRKII